VRGDLEHAVGARVDDRRARGEVLGAVALDHLGAARDHVAEVRPAGGRVEGVHHLGREALDDLERRGRDQAHELPVPRDRVLAGAHLAHAAVGALGLVDGLDLGDAGDVAQAERGEVREVERAGAHGVVQRVRAGVAEGLGVGQLADADGVEHDHGDGARPYGRPRPRRRGG
jgi:hypothetical protein